VRRAAVLAAVVGAALAVPAAAWPHAALLKTFPVASVKLNTSPKEVRLTYSEAVEPRFAHVSVTDANGTQEATGPPQRSPQNADELVVPVRHLSEGWYLVFWRAISVDGHPVRGVFTFAVGPNEGPIPQFVTPSLSETAATPSLVTARWAMFIAAMSAIGLLVLRLFVARPLRSPPRAITVAFWVSLAIALVATPVYVLMATAQFALRSAWDLGAVVPLMRTTAFGRSYLDLELLLALLAIAAGIALWVDRPARAKRSIAELLATTGALLAATGILLVPGAGGHANQTSPRALSVSLDWLHLASGSLWVGGLIGLLVLWRSLPAAERIAGLTICVPRFSNVALGSVIVLLGTGVWASFLPLPTLDSLWETSYGKAIIVKAALLLAAIVVASFNLLRTKPGLVRAEYAPRAAVLLRRLVATEVLLVAAAVAVAAVLSSLAPPSKALGAIGSPSAKVGPGVVTSTVSSHGYRLAFRVDPNKAAVPNTFRVAISRGGTPVRDATVIGTFTMLDMDMPALSYRLSETTPGVYEHAAPALVMVGHWGLSFQIEPRSGAPFDVVLLDRANG
jgi:copper transport protein